MTVVRPIDNRWQCVMNPLELHTLKRFCDENEIDHEEIDKTLTYYENKKLLERFIITPRAHEYCRPVLEDIEKDLVDACQAIIMRERKDLKWAKYHIGVRILKDEAYLTAKYGDDYFGSLASHIDEKGYGKDQLRKCVNFARHPSAESWLADVSLSWETIRTKKLRKELDPIESLPRECPSKYCPTLASISAQIWKIRELVDEVTGCNLERCLDCEKDYKCERMLHRMEKAVEEEVRRVAEERRLNYETLYPFLFAKKAETEAK